MPEAFKSNSHGPIRGVCSVINTIPEGLNSCDLHLYSDLKYFVLNG